MDTNSEAVMIALLPTRTDWCQINYPHMTLVYAGQFPDMQDSQFNAIAKDALSLAMTTGPFRLPVTGVEIFGDDTDGKVNVLTLMPSAKLLTMRKFVEPWNGSSHKDFKPHATIGPATNPLPQDLPGMLFFDSISVSWGTVRLTWPLGSMSIDN